MTLLLRTNDDAIEFMQLIALRQGYCKITFFAITSLTMTPFKSRRGEEPLEEKAFQM